MYWIIAAFLLGMIDDEIAYRWGGVPAVIIIFALGVILVFRHQIAGWVEIWKKIDDDPIARFVTTTRIWLGWK